MKGFPKLGVFIFGGAHYKSCSILVTLLGPPCLRKLPCVADMQKILVFFSLASWHQKGRMVHREATETQRNLQTLIPKP